MTYLVGWHFTKNHEKTISLNPIEATRSGVDSPSPPPRKLDECRVRLDCSVEFDNTNANLKTSKHKQETRFKKKRNTHFGRGGNNLSYCQAGIGGVLAW